VSNLDLTIGARRYTVACAAGEEAHVTELGRLVDTAIAANGLGSQTETRTLLFAALMLADELHEARRQLAEAAAAPEPQPQPQPEPQSEPQLDPQIEQRVDAITLRLEALAQSLERAP
jgi:cell division protein ZapA